MANSVSVTWFDKWLFYSSTKDFDKGSYYGEWLVFFSEEHYDYVTLKCMEAVSSGLVKWAKHSSLEQVRTDHKGLFALKLEDSAVSFVDGRPVSKQHQAVLKWLIDNGFIKRTKSGKYTNIRFKLDSEGKGQHVGSDWSGFVLSDFLDPVTGECL